MTGQIPCLNKSDLGKENIVAFVGTLRYTTLAMQ